jgi:polyhydroxyalkanoate synthesis regulator phasin
MIKRNLLKKVISGIVVGGLILSTGIIAMADTNTSSTTNPSTKTFSHSKGMMRGNRIGLSGGKMQQDMTAKLQATLTDLVTSGTITQDKADALKSYMTTKAAERKAELAKIKAMTPDERKAFIQTQKTANAGTRQDIFSSAVSSGILTQADADAIHARMQQVAQDARNKKMTDSLSTIVANGTITQEQMNTVLTFIAQEVQTQKDTFQKIKNMTAADRSAYFKNNATQNKNPLTELVTNGTLTQDQATAIAKVLRPMRLAPKAGRGRMGYGPKNSTVPQNTTN